MTFLAIIRKNFLFNVKKYLSLYFVYTLIVAILYMFGSLLYNPDVLRQVGNTTLYDIVWIALIGVVLFSIVFITYSNLSFLKYRGKEFGMYITLGMTTRDLTNLLFLENVGIAAVSLCSGLISGIVFGKLFYMGLNQILLVNKLRFGLSAGSLLLSSGIFLMIVCLNVVLNMIYIRKMPVVGMLQAALVQEEGKRGKVWGVLALILFAAAVLLLPGTVLGERFGGSRVLSAVFALLTLICPYVLIGTGITAVKSALKRFKRIYNNNLLVLSNVSHRFASYRVTLYIVSLLLAGAMFFIGMTYSMYATTGETVRRDNPYDVLFVESGPINRMDEAELAALLADNGDTLEQNLALEYIAIPEFRDYHGAWVLWDTQSMIISLSDFNRTLGTGYKLAEKQALFARVHKENMEFNVPDTILAAVSPEQAESVPMDSGSKEELLQALKDDAIREYQTGDIQEVTEPYINSVQNASAYFGQALVVDDTVYEQLKAAVPVDQVKRVHLLKGDISDSGFGALVNTLRERNGWDAAYWSNPYQNDLYAGDEARLKQEELRPVYREELLNRKLESNGAVFFVMMFLGALFVIASGMVLYHKVLSDMDVQKESMRSLKRLGVTSKELQKIVSKELAIVFMVPAVIGLGLGLYYIYVLFSNQDGITGMLGKAGIVAAVFFTAQIAFYFVSRRKYFSELGRGA